MALQDTPAVPSPCIRQHALTVVARVRDGERATLLGLLEREQKSVEDALDRVTTLHFGRLVVFDRADGDAALAFESNYDGDAQTHLQQLVHFIGPSLDRFFACCEGYVPGSFPSYAAGHSVAPLTYYISHGGLSRDQIRHDRDVRAAITKWLDAEDAAGRLDEMPPRDIAVRLQKHLSKQGLKVGPVDRGLPKQPWAAIPLIVLVLPAVVLTELVLAAAAVLVYEPADRREADASPPVIKSDNDPYLNSLIDAEDHNPQNGLTHVVPVKPGLFRNTALKVALFFVEQARRRLYFTGTLGGIASIHFARWSLLDDGTLVFFSNYDGSWESYLGDFVDKAHWFLTAIWTNTKWFPPTTALAFRGATQEAAFKQWARTFQVKNQIWYSAYPEVSVQNVLDNARIRELAGRPMRTTRQARRWLEML
jgi:hypothetical protein